MEKIMLTSLLVFAATFFCLIILPSECLVAHTFVQSETVHSLSRQKRSLEFSSEGRRIVRETGHNEKCNPKIGGVNAELAKPGVEEKFNREVELNGDSKTNLQLAWTGENFERVLILTSDPDDYSLYLSDETIVNYANKTSELGASFFGLQPTVVKHPTDSKIVYIVATGVMFVTLNGGESFRKVDLSFTIAGVNFHPTKSDHVLAVDDNNKDLYISKDSGLNWDKIQSKVFDVKWSTYPNSSDIFAMTNSNSSIFFGMILSSGFGSLERSTDFGKTWTTVATDIHSFGMEGRFLYCSKYASKDDQSSRNLMVSTDSGARWNRAQVPTINPDRFYSIVDSSDGRIMLHVDNPGDTGHGTLYISDATGIVFSESLKQHLYPNYDDLTDFYKVQSMRGVYLSSVINDDDSIHSVISTNGGAEWRPIPRPKDSSCPDENKKPCFLQINNAYSIRRGITSALPLSVPGAPGLILVHEKRIHRSIKGTDMDPNYVKSYTKEMVLVVLAINYTHNGTVGDSIQTTTPNVYVSSDGGYSWSLSLEGPHHYQIANNGAFIVAVPSSTDEPDTVKFSTDSGHCWIPYKFTNHSILFTGLVIEPNNKAMTIAIWGYTKDTRMWHTFVLDFSAIIKDKCQASDYEVIVANDHNNEEACVLGSLQTFTKIKDDSWCYNDQGFVPSTSEKLCACRREDYYCDYGYVRNLVSDTCERDPNVPFSELNICLQGQEQKRVFVGYQKLPENKCVGGFEPSSTQVIDLKTKCSNDNQKSMSDPVEEESNFRKNSILLGLFFLGLAVLVIVGITYIARKYRVYRKTRMTLRYSSIKCEDADDDEAALEALRRNTSLYDNTSDDDDDDNDEAANITVRSSPSKNNASKAPYFSAPPRKQSTNGSVSSSASNNKVNGIGKAGGVASYGSSAATNSLVDINVTTPTVVTSDVRRHPTNNRGILDETDDELVH